MLYLFALTPAHADTFTLCKTPGCDFTDSLTNAIGGLQDDDELEITEPGDYGASSLNFNGRDITVRATVPGVVLSNAFISSPSSGMVFENVTLACNSSLFVLLGSNQSLSLENVRAWECQNNDGGGLAYLDHASAELDISNSWIRNSQSGSGAVVRITAGVANIRGSLFCDNQGDKGGVLYRESGSGDVLVQGNLFVANEGTEGGVIQNEAPGGLILDHNTFRSNNADDGAALFLNQDDVVVTNNLVLESRSSFAISPGAPMGVYSWNGWWDNGWGDVEGGGLGDFPQDGDPLLPLPTATLCDPHLARPTALEYAQGGQLMSEIGFYGALGPLVTAWNDDDSDGVMAFWDCDDGDPDRNDLATEVCGDNIDNDCDGVIDNGVAYTDSDGDGFGDPNSALGLCGGSGVSDNTDCDDSNILVFPGAIEACDGLDTDCDGLTPPNETDFDMDTFRVCDGDCDDENADVNPGASEVCDGSDTDCDGFTPPDEVDADMDGFRACVDCDDTEADAFPGNTEICDMFDNNCDGDIDEGLAVQFFYTDADTDGYGDENDPGIEACTNPGGLVVSNTDCDDSQPTVNPLAGEACDELDNNCNGDIDEGLPLLTFYPDGDGDDFGDLNQPEMACEVPSGSTLDGTDCDDAESTVYPEAPEICDGLDNDCNTLIDDGTVQLDWYPDADQDGYGEAVGLVVESCDPVPGHAPNDGDCDDATASVSPVADELCNGIDDDCDTAIDESDAVDAPLSFADVDQDGFGDAEDPGQSSCVPPPGRVDTNSDCDDSEDTVYPGAPEACPDGLDNDCDGDIDADDADFQEVGATYWEDTDGDGYGEPSSSTQFCSDVLPAGWVAPVVGLDCDDNNPTIYPSAPEICDGIDQDCDNQPDNGLIVQNWFPDHDLDGYGAGTGTSECEPPGAGFSMLAGDCDDEDPNVNPEGIEICNELDDDCDGVADEDLPTVPSFEDLDGDGFGGIALAETCAPVEGSIPTGGDCDDTDEFAYPDAPETCGDADLNCDGELVVAQDHWPDADGDGFGDGTVPPTSACEPLGAVPNSGDCDDSDPEVTTECSTDGVPAPSGCRCDSGGGPSGWLMVGWLAAFWVRRTRIRDRDASAA